MIDQSLSITLQTLSPTGLPSGMQLLAYWPLLPSLNPGGVTLSIRQQSGQRSLRHPHESLLYFFFCYNANYSMKQSLCLKCDPWCLWFSIIPICFPHNIYSHKNVKMNLVLCSISVYQKVISMRTQIYIYLLHSVPILRIRNAQRILFCLHKFIPSLSLMGRTWS